MAHLIVVHPTANASANTLALESERLSDDSDAIEGLDDDQVTLDTVAPSLPAAGAISHS